MTVLTREQILARKVAGTTEKHTFPDGSVVMIRGLTRNESFDVRKARDAGDLADADNLVIHYGLVDPALSVDDVATWGAEDSAGDLTGLSNHIAEISGMLEGAGKSRVPSARKRS